MTNIDNQNDSYKDLPKVSSLMLSALYFHFLYIIYLSFYDYYNLLILLPIITGYYGLVYQYVYFINFYIYGTLLSNIYRLMFLVNYVSIDETNKLFNQLISFIYGCELFITEMFINQVYKFRKRIEIYKQKHTIYVVSNDSDTDNYV